MKNKFAKILILTIVVALMLATFVSCIDDEIPTDEQLRKDALALLKGQIMDSLNDLWTGNMTEENIAGLANAGDYYIALGWANFATEVVDESGLQTAKIKGLADFMKSDDGVKLLQGEGLQILDFVTLAGLTNTDTENLVYTAIVLFLNEGDKIFAGAVDNINSLSSNPTLSSATRQNLNDALAKLNVGSKSFLNTVKSRQNAVQALKDAKSGLKTIVSFVYNNTVYFSNNANDGFFDGLSKGTLDGATSSEIATYLGAMFDSIQSMIEGIEGQIDKVNVALDALSEVYDGIVVDNKVINDIFGIVEDSKTLTALIPMLSKVVDNGRNIALKSNGTDHLFVDEIKIVLGEGYAYQGSDTSANELIGYIRMGLALSGIDYKATGDTFAVQKAGAKAFVKDVIDRLYGADNEVQKSNAMLLCAALYLDSPSGTMIGDIPAIRVCEYWLANLYLDNFKKLYTKYSVGVEVDAMALRTTAQVLMRYVTGEDVVDVGTDYSKVWFDDVCNQVETKMYNEINECYPAVKNDIDDKVDKFFNEGLDKLIGLALKDPVKMDDENYLAFADEVDSLYESVLLLFFPEEAEQ